MAQNSSFNSKSGKTVCGIAMNGIKTAFKGPSPQVPADKDDIVDEVIKLYRFNVVMKSFSIKGSSDKTYVYLTVYLSKLLKELTKA